MYIQSSGQVTLYEKMMEYERVRVVLSIKTGQTTMFSMYRDILKDEERRKKHRALYRHIMKQLKINGCSICGYDACLTSLVFHHVNPKDKKFQVSMGSLSKPDKVLIEELNKCMLLCANCHGEIEEQEDKK